MPSGNSSLYPIITDQAETYQKFISQTTQHSKGFFILAPSGTGKTYYIKNQSSPDWIDGDDLWVATGAHPNSEWWKQGLDVISEVDARSDLVTQTARRMGLWLLGASNNWLVPDAVVLPNWSTNVKWIIHREKTHYDGGLKSDQLAQLKSHRIEIRSRARKNKVPIFKSIEEAVVYCNDVYRKALKREEGH